jgi:hypothetical protein
MAAEIEARRGRRFGDFAPVRALEDFLHAVVQAPETLNLSTRLDRETVQPGVDGADHFGYGPSALPAASTNSVTTMSS